MQFPGLQRQRSAYIRKLSGCIELISFLFLAFSVSVSGQVVDKSGMRPNVLSLPSGPGSVQGLGGSFNPHYATGTYDYKIPLKVPPGRNGFSPSLTLAYDTGYGNGIFGMGWRLDLPYITRQSPNRLPLYIDYSPTNTFYDGSDGTGDVLGGYDTIVYSGTDELVPTSDGYWRCQYEGKFLRFVQESSGGWIATRKDGVVLTFGTNQLARVQDSQGRIFMWYLDSMTDLHGNRITFHYQKLDNSDQAYCTSITYNEADQILVVLNYQPRPDTVSDCRATYQVQTSYRCSSISTLVNSNVVLNYTFGYQATNCIQRLSMLDSIQETSGDGLTQLPPEQFNYVTFNSTNVQVNVMTNAPQIDLSDANIQLVDLNGDGLPDILDTSTQPHTYFLNLGPQADGSIGWSQRQYMQSDVGVYLEDDTSELADMEGTGRANLLSLFAGNNPELFTLDNNLEWESIGVMNGTEFSLSDPNVRLMDANGDRLIDAMETSGNDILTWINLGAQSWSDPIITSSPDPTLQFSQPQTRLADMNGDGLMDLIYLDNEICYYYPGLGYGQFGPKITMLNPPSNVSDTTKMFLIDVNGDGLADIVVVDQNIQIYLNMGLDPGSTNTGHFSAPIIINTPYVNDFTVVRAADMDGNGVQDIVLNADIGNGPQLAYVTLSGFQRANQLMQITNGIGQTTTISYTSSVDERVRDQGLGTPWPDPVPISISVVGQVQRDAGFEVNTQTMHYHNGYYDPAKEEFRGFARAEVTHVGDASVPDLVNSYQYDIGKTNEALKGTLLVEEAGIGPDTSVWPEYNPQGTGVPSSLDAPYLYYRKQTAWQLQTVATAATNDPRSVTFASPTNISTEILELGDGMATTVNELFNYDNYGNLILHTELGRTNDPPASQRKTMTTYSSAYSQNVTNWLLDRVVSNSVYDGLGNLAAQTLNYYDSFAIPGLIQNGDLTLAQSWVQGSHFATTTHRDYDSYGNMIATYDPDYGQSPGHYRQIEYDAAYHTFPIQETIYTGNPNVTALTATAAYNVGFGVITNYTDFNNNATVYTYDGIGRLSGIIKPLDGTNTTAYQYVLGTNVENNRIVNWIDTCSRDTNQPGGYVLSRTFYDGMGDQLMTKQQAEPVAGSTIPQVVISGAVTFNSQQKPALNLNPCFSLIGGSSLDQLMAFEDITAPSWQAQFHQNGSLVALGLASAPVTSMNYDGLLRQTQVINPDGTIRQVAYQPLIKQIYDENASATNSPFFNTPFIQYQDGLGRLVRVDEMNRLSDTGTFSGTLHAWSTYYNYDANNMLINSVDSQGNQKNITCDGLQRMVFINDPDQGIRNLVYDDAGNLLSTVDAKGQTIVYSYDGANRRLTESYGTNVLPSVTYHYDQPSPNVPFGDGRNFTAANVIGRLAWVQDLSGEEHTSYDARGRVAYVTKRIPDPQFLALTNLQAIGGLVSYTTQFSYDSLDRIVNLIYPDNDEISYHYNARGLSAAITGEACGIIISNAVYTPAGQSAISYYGNGLQTVRSYDSRLRLTVLLTKAGILSSNQELLHSVYTFDPASNIKSIQDMRPLTVVPVGDPRRNNQVFGYDDLNRLVFAGYSFDGPGSTNSDSGYINYNYDRIGNMLSETSSMTNTVTATGLPSVNLGSMQSGGSAGSFNRVGRGPNDPPGPHALTTINNDQTSPRYYSYDANGNMTIADGLTNTWDFKNRLSTVANSQMQALYIYDYTVALLKMSGPHAPTQPCLVPFHCLRQSYTWTNILRFVNMMPRQNTSGMETSA